MRKNKEEIIEYINSLQGYTGYVQFSDRSIEDIFTIASDIQVDPKDGFVYEAHFSNGKESIAIRQINSEWLVSKTNISDVPDEDRQTYHAFEKNVEMAQIWEDEEDLLCEEMKVKKLKKVVFAGFVGGER